ncbi:unnamed protein product [Hyaloperonospora brassicae]|uniref:Uncharacterized protein n=1 Tax=Hyaloperonospora brassicae TaxID=162125 RepID=A0AAV0THT1_HYABA|nr:unnamed protein product [Hyaloperonospora brassicae]
MVVTNSASVAGMNISNSDFDGRTNFSFSCDGHHYWALLFTEEKRLSPWSRITCMGPRVGHLNSVAWKVTVSLCTPSTTIGATTRVTLLMSTPTDTFSPNETISTTRSSLCFRARKELLNAYNGMNDADLCTSYLGRPCKANVLVRSGIFIPRNGPLALEAMKASLNIIGYSPDSTPTIDSAKEWAETTGNFGVGKLN